jgi:hypothetical protein
MPKQPKSNQTNPKHRNLVLIAKTTQHKPNKPKTCQNLVLEVETTQLRPNFGQNITQTQTN